MAGKSIAWKDQAILCALVAAAGGSIEQTKRLEVGAYLLSAGARQRGDGSPGAAPLSFLFPVFSHAAMADDRLRDTVDYLTFHQLLTETVEEDHDRHRPLHGHVHLTDAGRVVARRGVALLSAQQRTAVKDLGTVLGDPSVHVGDLLLGRCRGWLGQMEQVVAGILGPPGHRAPRDRRGLSLGSWILLLPWTPGRSALDRIARGIPFLLRDSHSALRLDAPLRLGGPTIEGRFRVDWEMLDDYLPTGRVIEPLQRLRQALQQRAFVARLTVHEQGWLQWELRAPAGAPMLRLRGPRPWGVAQEACLHTLGRAPPLVAVLRTAPRHGAGALPPSSRLARAWPRAYHRPSAHRSVRGALASTARRWDGKLALLADPKGVAGGADGRRRALTLGHLLSAQALGVRASAPRRARG